MPSCYEAIFFVNNSRPICKFVYIVWIYWTTYCIYLGLGVLFRLFFRIFKFLESENFFFFFFLNICFPCKILTVREDIFMKELNKIGVFWSFLVR